MKKGRTKLAAVLTLCCLVLAGGASFAAEFEVLDRFSVDGYTVFRGSADIPGGSFTVGGSTFVVKSGNVGIGTANPSAGRLAVAGDDQIPGAVFSTPSTSGGGYTGIEMQYGGNPGSKIARIIGTIVSGGGGNLTFETPTGGEANSYSSKMTIMRDGAVSVNSGGLTAVGDGVFGKNEAVNHSIQILTGSANEPSLFLYPSSNYGFTVGNFIESGNRYFEVRSNNGSKQIVIGPNDTGNIGIGTTGPGFQFDILSALTGTADRGNVIAGIRANGSGRNVTLRLSDSVTNSSDISMTGNRVQLSVNGIASLYYNDSGNVGIGAASPSGVLDLGSATSGRALSWGGTGSNYANIWTPYSGSGLVLAVGLRGGTSADSYLSSTVESVARTAVRLNYGGAAGIQFFTDAASVIADGTAIIPTARLTINTSGNVGIGTTNPAARLHVNIAGVPSATIINEVSDFGGNIIGLGGLSNIGDRTGIFTGADGGIGAGIEMGRQGSGWGSYLAFYTNNVTSGPEGPDAIQERVRIDQNGNVGIGTTSPGALLEVNGALKVGGSETGTAASDIKAYIQQIACENRRGVWIDGTGCQEYAYFTATSGVWGAVSCASGHHICTFPDLFAGGFASLRRKGYNAGTSYIWLGGSYPGQQDKFFYPWGNGIEVGCTAGSHYMMDFRRSAAGSTAWGCYPDSFVNVVACCRDNQ